MKTTIEEIKKFIQTEVDLNFMTQKNADRLNYYLDTFFVKEEKDRIVNAFDTGFKDTGLSFLTGEKYYQKTFGDIAE
ncbi:hypothetical protein AAIP31_002341 [Flavobacterium psychrophilum]